jgi:hypothetical protein
MRAIGCFPQLVQTGNLVRSSVWALSTLPSRQRLLQQQSNARRRILDLHNRDRGTARDGYFGHVSVSINPWQRPRR